jgi:type IV pilus assembly protein PilY1
MRGNFWKFSDLSGTPTATKMFEARGPGGAEQPITAAPTGARDPDTGIVWVYFGTGRYLDEEDARNKQVQTWYGLKDESRASLSDRDDLVDRDILEQGTPAGSRFIVRTIEEGTPEELLNKDGWLIDLVPPPTAAAEEERIILPPRFSGDALTVTTRIPNIRDACAPSGSSWIYAINPFTGARRERLYFDLNDDEEYNSSDTLNGDGASAIFEEDGAAGNSNTYGNRAGYGTDGGDRDGYGFQGGDSEAGRLSWRELVN